MRQSAPRLLVVITLLAAALVTGCSSTSQAADANATGQAGGSGGSNTLTDAVLIVVLEDLIPADAEQLAAEHISRNEASQLTDIGFSTIGYDDQGRIERIGTARVLRNAEGLPIEIGGRLLTYDTQEQITRIGDSAVTYEAGRLTQVGSETIRYSSDGSVQRIGERTILLVGDIPEAAPAS